MYSPRQDDYDHSGDGTDPDLHPAPLRLGPDRRAITKEVDEPPARSVEFSRVPIDGPPIRPKPIADGGRVVAHEDRVRYHLEVVLRAPFRAGGLAPSAPDPGRSSLAVVPVLRAAAATPDLQHSVTPRRAQPDPGSRLAGVPEPPSDAG